MTVLDALTQDQRRSLEEAMGIMNQVYDNEIDPEIYANEHYGNPLRISEPFSISREGDEPAGLSAFIGMKLIYDKRVMKVVQAVDGAVADFARGKGHYSKAFKTFEEKNKECEFIIGLPNKNSYPRLIHYGFNRVVWLCHYIYATAPWGFVFGKNIATKVLDKGWRAMLSLKRVELKDNEELELFPVIGYGELDKNNVKKEMKKLFVPISDEEISILWAESMCHFMHTTDIYRWKFSYNPDTNFYWSVLRERNGRLRGYALCHLRKKAKGHMVIIDDYRTDAKDDAEKIRIYKLLFSKFIDLGGLLEVPFANDESGDGAILKKLHFINATNIPFGLRGGPLIVSSSCRYRKQLAGCEFRNIDSDVL
ncbi:hypothetical protein [Butyrivibrio sp. WCD3002]|uniref:hypothetical protein n=1 Tax=Butyrivibrio sp. WCD3002 TaxID=1280676 RepID=UPI0003F64B06|nr:hypothetical protein [Butyrivibrio sp. WCD3002]